MDGSALKHRVTSGFFLVNPDYPDITILGGNECPGTVWASDSCRAELAGTFGALVLLFGLCSQHNVRKGKVTVVLDGKSTMEDSQKTSFHPRKPSQDLLHAIRFKIGHLHRKFRISVLFKWVKGHQYDNYGHESFLGMMN